MRKAEAKIQSIRHDKPKFFPVPGIGSAAHSIVDASQFRVGGYDDGGRGPKKMLRHIKLAVEKTLADDNFAVGSDPNSKHIDEVMKAENGESIETKKNFLRFKDAIRSGYVENPIF